jgi:hypothetical protein
MRGGDTVAVFMGGQHSLEPVVQGHAAGTVTGPAAFHEWTHYRGQP